MSYGDEMVDVTGKVIVELRSNAAVFAIAGNRVGGRTSSAGWSGNAYVLVERIGPIRRFPRASFFRGRLSVTAFGRTDQEAAALYGAISDVLAGRGPRQSAGGVALYRSEEEVGGQAVLDPDNDQPAERSIYIYSAPLAQAGS